jgi:ureidoglycolate lyase
MTHASPLTHSADITAHARTLTAQALTPSAFSAFGEVVEHQGEQRRHFLPGTTAYPAHAGQPSLWVSRIDQALAAPVRITTLERHSRSPQTFIPLTNTPALIVVAPSLPNGLPDTENMQAFLASGSQGVCYAPGVWHHGLTPLQAPAQFVVTMAKVGDGHDDEFLALADAVAVSWEQETLASLAP